MSTKLIFVFKQLTFSDIGPLSFSRLIYFLSPCFVVAVVVF